MKPYLVTMGDAAGIGPEIVVKLLAGFPPRRDVVVVGERWILEAEAKKQRLDLEFHDYGEARSPCVRVRSLGLLSPGSFEPGAVDPVCGEAAFGYFEAAVRECMNGQARGIVTAPISKEAINRAGHRYLGHTDILASMTGRPTVMALFHPKLIVTHVTDHLSLRDALDAITPERLEFVIRTTWKAVAAFRSRPPRIALAGVNPHAGENGLLGKEEIEIIQPTLAKLATAGIRVKGPLPGDTVFNAALRQGFDAVIAMYHDQGFGPMKTLDFANGVNCTLGLPFPRTSPDHGTAFDLAGKNRADPTSMLRAWELLLVLAGD